MNTSNSLNMHQDERFAGSAKKSFLAFVLLLTLLVSFLGFSPAQAAPQRVCAPNNKCVSAPKVCKPDDGCGKNLYQEVPSTDYCSPSTGCFNWQGKNYRYIGGPALSPADQDKMQKCAASLGVTWLGAVAEGPIGITILGVAVSLWGCT